MRMVRGAGHRAPPSRAAMVVALDCARRIFLVACLPSAVRCFRVPALLLPVLFGRACSPTQVVSSLQSPLLGLAYSRTVVASSRQPLLSGLACCFLGVTCPRAGALELHGVAAVIGHLLMDSQRGIAHD